MTKRTAFFISDSTGITAETLGESLLAHFDTIEFDKVILPYVDNGEKARLAVARINQAAAMDGVAPLIFDTVVDREIRAILAASHGFVVDLFATFLEPLERELNAPSNFTVGRGPVSATNNNLYSRRIEAVHYALDNDDGARLHRYDEAELILLGISRSGKTPTSIYLALQAGIFVANYPLTEDDLDQPRLPKLLEPFRARLYALTIKPDRLAAIRSERRADSRYASLKQCEDEVRLAEGLYRKLHIPFIDTTDISIEEIATRILADTGLRKYRK